MQLRAYHSSPSRTIGIHSLLLLSLGEMFNTPILVWLLIHVPLAVLEGALVGVTVGFLARVKPELLAGFTNQENVLEFLKPATCDKQQSLQTSAPGGSPGAK